MSLIPTVPYALTTVERLKNRLGISAGVISFDTVLGEIVATVTDYIERGCGGRRFLQMSYTQEIYDGYNLDGTFKKNLILRHAPMAAAPSSFQYRTGTKSNPVWIDFQIDTYQEILYQGIVRVGLPPGWQNIRISYIAGYLINFAAEFDKTQHTLPFDLSDLCERLATKVFKHRESEGKDTESFNGSSVKWSDFTDDRDELIMQNHSRPSFV